MSNVSLVELSEECRWLDRINQPLELPYLYRNSDRDRLTPVLISLRARCLRGKVLPAVVLERDIPRTLDS
jgi:hypothetical protein